MSALPEGSSLHKLSKEEWGKILAESGGLKVLVDEAHVIENYSDFKFTADGRTFALFLGGDSILHRLRAKSVLIDEKNKDGIKQAESVSGMILEVDTDDPPLIFPDDETLVSNWIEFHRMYGLVPCSVEEIEALEAISLVEIEDALRPPELRKADADESDDGEES
jgi:hypothetical protein